MKNLINTINKELKGNNLYLNHCSTEIQILRSLNDITPILKLKPLDSLKSILNELLITKKEQVERMSQEFEILTEQEEKRASEFNQDFEKANNQIIEKYESKNENETNNFQKNIDDFYSFLEKFVNC